MPALALLPATLAEVPATPPLLDPALPLAAPATLLEKSVTSGEPQPTLIDTATESTATRLTVRATPAVLRIRFNDTDGAALVRDFCEGSTGAHTGTPQGGAD